MTPHSIAAVTMPATTKLFAWRSSFASTYAHSSDSSTSSSSSGSSSSDSFSSGDEALDLEALALSAGSDYEDTCRSSRWRQHSSVYEGCYDSAPMRRAVGGGSGLPLVCSNCGVSFFSLQITDDELECYCSGECKWSVVMYHEMDRRMHALRRHVRATATAVATTTQAVQRPATVAIGSFVASARSSNVSAVATSESYAAHMMDGVIPCR